MYIQNPEQFIKENIIDKLDIEQAKEIYDKLVDDLNYHNFLYYVKSQPVISDYEYDLLFHYLEDLEKKFPQLIRKDSPTQRLTNQIQSELKKAKHIYPLLSLENTYNPEEVEEKLNKLENEYWVKNFYIEPKYDGLSIELIYENGYFQQAITRWNGYEWEDVTENAKTIRTLPLKISYKWKLHVRGEVVVRKSIFTKINNEQEKKGLETYSNPRNLASWSLRQLDASITAKRQLDVVTYEVLNFQDVNLSTHTQSLDFLEENWFFVFDINRITGWKQDLKDRNELDSETSLEWQKRNSEGNHKFSDILYYSQIFSHRHWLNKEQILEVVKSEEIKNLLDNQDIEFDGLVIKVNEEKYWSLIWSTSHHPKWAFAFKYPATQISTQILDIELSVWRTGVITPVAILQAVDFSGVTVQKASLHNFDFIKEKDIHIGDYVFVQRSGEVIPYVVWVIIERREKKQKNLEKIENLIKSYLDKAKKENSDYENSYLEYLLKYNLYKNILDYNYLVKIIEPPYCPVCGWETFHPEWEVALRCINVACPAQIKEKISYFVSKNGLDIEWLSEKTIEVLLKVGLIKDYWDIFTLKSKRQQLLSLPGFKEKKVENILNSIEEKRQIPLNIFLQALWIEFVWKKTAKLIVTGLEQDSSIKAGFVGLKQEVRREKKNEDLIYSNDDWYVDFNKVVEFLVSEKGEEFLLSINWIWPKVVQSIRKFFHEKHNKKIIEKLLKYVKIKFDTTKQWKFSWQSFVITWSIPWISRDIIEKFIEENGWEFSNQVTKETSLLLVWEKPWNSKLEKAQEYNILTYDLYKFLKENWFTFPVNTKIQESLF